MNLEEFPERVKNDIEDQSLTLLEIVKDDIVVIGGWAVRVLAGKKHIRYTLDIDGITPRENLPKIKRKLQNLLTRESDWGTQFYQRYVPQVDITNKEVMEAVEQVELRMEISEPRIKEFQSHHYFEFDLSECESRKIRYHNKPEVLTVKVPSAEKMAAVKLGLPADYKNNFDAAVLLQMSDIDRVIQAIKENNDWSEMVLRRMDKKIGRAKDPARLEHALLINAEITIREYVNKLKYIKDQLKEG